MFHKRGSPRKKSRKCVIFFQIYNFKYGINSFDYLLIFISFWRVWRWFIFWYFFIRIVEFYLYIQKNWKNVNFIMPCHERDSPLYEKYNPPARYKLLILPGWLLCFNVEWWVRVRDKSPDRQIHCTVDIIPNDLLEWFFGKDQIIGRGFY